MEKKALGRGLRALITEIPVEKEEGVIRIKTDELVTSRFQPREIFNQDKLDELITSIKEKGVIQPIIVRPSDKGYEVIAGERRLRAVRALGLNEIPAIVRQVSDNEALQISLIENIQRDNLNPVEEAQAYQRLIDEFGLNQEDVAQRVGKDRATVANTLRLLKLPQKIKEYLRNGKLSLGHGRALLSISEQSVQLKIATKTMERELTVRQVETLVQNELSPKIKKKARHKDHHLASVEEELQRTLGTRVRILAGRRRGKIVIDYYSHDDFDRLVKLLNKKEN